MDILAAMRGRASVRAYLNKPVASQTIRDMLAAARFAPSGVNTQPWQVAVVTGATKTALTQAILAARKEGVKEHPDYHYYPRDWFEPYKARRFACGMALYGALQIERDDHARRQQVWDLNYHFFHAPVALLFFVDKRLEKGSWLDCGMFIQNVMLAARHFGLDTCAQASIADYPNEVKQVLAMQDDLALICGMALGYADPAQAINQYRTERAGVDDFTSWHQ
jgi:nitroreductase